MSITVNLGACHCLSLGELERGGGGGSPEGSHGFKKIDCQLTTKEWRGEGGRGEGGGGGGSWHYGRITWILSGHKQTPSTPRRSILIGLLTGIVPRFPWCNKLDLFKWPQSQFQRCKSLELNEHGSIYFLQELSEGVVEISYPWWIMLIVNMKAIIYSQSCTGINSFFRPHFHCC